MLRPQEVTSVAFSPDGGRIVSGSRDNVVCMYNIATGMQEVTLEGHLDPVMSVDFSHDGRSIVSGSDDTTIHQEKNRLLLSFM